MEKVACFHCVKLLWRLRNNFLDVLTIELIVLEDLREERKDLTDLPERIGLVLSAMVLAFLRATADIIASKEGGTEGPMPSYKS